MFTATSFIFDGVPSEEFDVMLYFLDNNSTVEDEYWTNEIIEDRLNARYNPIFYGININKQMSFNIIVGSTKYLSRHDIERVGDWLTSHNTYKWLEICQDDMRDFRYKVIFTEVKGVHVNGLPVALNCTVVTDCQFAYEYPVDFTYVIRDGKVVNYASDGTEKLSTSAKLYNRSSYNGYLYPITTIKIDDGCENFSIVNTSDGNRTFTITSFPNNSSSIADVFQGLVDTYEEWYEESERLILLRDKLLSFINEYKGYPNSSSDLGITDSFVDSYLAKSISELESGLKSLENKLKTIKYYELFSPSDYSGGLLTSDDMLFHVRDNFETEEHIATTSNLEWLTELKNSNADYDYEDYNLIPIYNYFAELENGSTANVDFYETQAQICLIRAILDYIPLNEETEAAIENKNHYYEEVNSYGLSGDVNVDGDELVVTIDNKNQIMDSNRLNFNIYEYFGDEYGNHDFLRLVRGDNELVFTGSGTVTITCEFLRKVGV